MKQDAQRLLKALWIRACRYERVHPQSMFVVFSTSNPYKQRYDKIMRLVQAARRMSA